MDYYFSKWPKWPSQETMFEFAEIYTTEYKKQVKNDFLKIFMCPSSSSS